MENYENVPQQADPQGEKAATTSLVCGIVGLFIAGLILGIVAIVQSNKAKSLGVTNGKQKAGFILGIIDLVGMVLVFGLQIAANLG